MAKPLPFEDVERTERAESEPALLVDVDGFEGPLDLLLELAADYLVMAAWLAYLKARLLLPEPPKGEEPSAEELATALALRLRRLEAIREAAKKLEQRDRLGREFFARGAPEPVEIRGVPRFEATL